jgi:hypothetical protein
MDSSMLFWLLLSAVVIIAGFSLFMVYFFLSHDYKRRRLEILAKDNAEILKLRFQAYERLTLLLERLMPESLILREQRHDMDCQAFHSLLLRTIRQEFNHNLAMQVYVTIPTWEKVLIAREKLMKLINTSASRSKPDMPALLLGKTIIEEANPEVTYHFNDALKSIKSEIESYYSR